MNATTTIENQPASDEAERKAGFAGPSGSVSLWEQFKAMPLEHQTRIARNGFCWIWGRLEGSGTEIEEQFFRRVAADMTPNT